MKNKKNTNQSSFSSDRRNSDRKSSSSKGSVEGRRSGENRFSSEKKYTGEKRNSAEGRSSRDNNFSGEKRFSKEKSNSGEKKSFDIGKFSGEKKSSDDRKSYGGKKFSGEKRYSSDKSFSGERKSYGEGKYSGEKKYSGDRKKPEDNKFSGEKRYASDKSFDDAEFFEEKRAYVEKKKFSKPEGSNDLKNTETLDWKESKVTPASAKTIREKKVAQKKSVADNAEQIEGSKTPFDKNARAKSPKEFYSKEAPNKDDYKVVYRGRGRDEKPIFETVRKDEVEQKPKKSLTKFKKPLFDQPKDEKPSYNFEKFENKSKKEEEEEGLRLNKYIANSGICSRREADELIKKGEVKVNGEVITEMGHRVLISDNVVYKGKKINPEKPVYVLLNKPKDFITTTDDPLERKTVMQLIQNACEERLYPVGRLDRNTTGLLLFTNDGELAAKLSHPSSNIKKIYQVTLDKPLTKGDEATILEGFELEDGPVMVDDMQVLSKDRTILGIEIHIGRNRIVKRIFAHFGYEVIALDRVTYAGLDKKDLTRGKYRFLTEKEVIQLKFFK